MTMWADDGPASPGKILIAILQGRAEEARRLLSGWSDSDLLSLDHAAQDLSHLSRMVRRRRMTLRQVSP